jgi:hypothetical protein
MIQELETIKYGSEFENIHVNLPTFIVNNLQGSEGKWYYCVRVPNNGVQVGWATNGFTY